MEEVHSVAVDPLFFGSSPALSPEEEEKAFLESYGASLRDLCDYDPVPLAGLPLGMFHCPDCGCMILAGVPHPPCDPDFCGLAGLPD